MVGFYLGLVIGIPFGMLVAALPWRDARAAVDLTPSLPVAVCKPTAWRKSRQ